MLQSYIIIANKRNGVWQLYSPDYQETPPVHHRDFTEAKDRLTADLDKAARQRHVLGLTQPTPSKMTQIYVSMPGTKGHRSQST